MTTTKNLDITLNVSDSESDEITPFVTLTAIDPEVSSSLTQAQLYRMWYRALSGLSARAYKPGGCPIEWSEDGTAHVWFDFYCYPSSKDLSFSLSASGGTLGTAEICEVSRETDVVFELADTVDLEFLPVSGSVAWETDCYNEDCERVATPSISLNGPQLVASAEIFGVARLKAQAYAKKYRLHIYIAKGTDDELQEVTLDDPVITCSWTADDETESDTLTLEVPDCVATALALCGGGGLASWCKKKAGQKTVYVSKCDGSILDVRTADPEDYCGDD